MRTHSLGLLTTALNYTAVFVPVTGVGSSRLRLMILLKTNNSDDI